VSGNSPVGAGLGIAGDPVSMTLNGCYLGRAVSEVRLTRRGRVGWDEKYMETVIAGSPL